jgi:hypothetical protein
MHVRLDDVVERDRPLYAIGGVHCTLLHRLSLLAGFLFLLGEGTGLMSRFDTGGEVKKARPHPVAWRE